MAEENKTKEVAAESKTEDSLSDKMTKTAETLQNVVKPLIPIVTSLLPILIAGCQKSYEFYKKLPMNVVSLIIGFVFCFFGGLYPTLFAALEAANHGGLKILGESLSTLADEAMIVLEENKKDDEKDDDGDGVPDVEQIDEKQIVLRKVNLVMTKINPAKVDNAIAAIYSVWLSVVAVLTIQFARTIALALSISDFIRKPVDKYIAPTIAIVMPKGYKKWVPVVLGWIAKSIGMSIAWFVQRVVSAFASACKGGLIMSRAIMAICCKKGWRLGGLIKENEEDTSFDENMSYVFAALGFYFQYKLGFDMPFPFNILLWPLEVAEYYIQWSITKA
jgi:hypothetical protein